MILKKIPVFVFILALLFAVNYQKLPVHPAYAQDDDSGEEPAEEERQDEPEEDSNDEDPPAEEHYDEDENFPPDEDNRTLDETREDGKKDEGDFDGSLKAGGGDSEDVNKAREEESKAYQDLYAYEAEHGADGSEEHQKLFDNAGAASAATQVAEGTFGQSIKQKLGEVTSVGEATKDVREELSEEALKKVSPDDYAEYASKVISKNTKNMDMSQVAAVIGGAIKDPKVAGEIARQQAEDRGEGVGTQMGSYQIAYATAGGTNVTGDQVTKASIQATLESLDLSDPKQSLTFAEASYATARSHNADIGAVTQQLKGLKIPENTILAAAENKGVGKEAGATYAAAPAVAQAGPGNETVAVPEAAAGKPAQVAPPAPAQDPGTRIPFTPREVQRDPAPPAENNVVKGITYGAPTPTKPDPAAPEWSGVTVEGDKGTDHYSLTLSTNGRESSANGTGPLTTPEGEPLGIIGTIEITHMQAAPRAEDLKDAKSIQNFIDKNRSSGTATYIPK